jgi:LysM repeat protein
MRQLPKLGHMKSWILLGGLGLLAVAAHAQSVPAANAAYEITSLREDVRLLQQRVGEMAMTVEQLNRENNSLQTKANQSYVTLDQLNHAIADLNRTLQAGLSEQKRDILNQVGTQVEKLAKQTQAAVDAVAKGQATRPVVQNFSDEFSKEGVDYTVQTGDTLAVIAKKTNAKVQDIINANKISDPSKIQVGQKLFIPQAK